MILLMNNTHNVTADLTKELEIVRTIKSLLVERDAIKAKFDCSDASWQALFAVEAKINAAGGMHLIGTTYNED
jgi:hypothetical protein